MTVDPGPLDPSKAVEYACTDKDVFSSYATWRIDEQAAKSAYAEMVRFLRLNHKLTKGIER